jgi:CheY-like chemotaxis protein
MVIAITRPCLPNWQTGSRVKVLLTSGYSPELAGDGAGPVTQLLTKPFRRDELLAAVREALDA